MWFYRGPSVIQTNHLRNAVFKGVGAMALGGFLGVGISGCTPLLTSYPGGVQVQLKSVAVENIPDYSGQYLRIALTKMLTPEGCEKPKYRLFVKLKKTQSAVGLTHQATSNRVRLSMEAQYTLKAQENRKTLLKNTLLAHSSYTYMPGGFYSNTISGEAAERESLEIIAQNLFLDLGQFFSKTQESSDKEVRH